MENPHRPVDGEGPAQMRFIKIKVSIRADLYHTGESVIGKRPADSVFDSRMALHFLDKIECAADGHATQIANVTTIIK